MLWFTAIGILLVIFMLGLLPLSLVAHVHYEWPTLQFSLTLQYLRVLHHTFRSGKPDTNTAHPSESQQPLTETQQPGFLEQVDRILEMLPAVRARVVAFEMKRFTWHSRIGLADAGQTAVISGIVWTGKGLIMGILTDWFVFSCQPELSVDPVYGSLALETEASCILRCSLGKAMWAGWRLYRLLRSRKVRDAHASRRAPHSISDANGHGEPERDGGRQHNYRRSG